MNDRTQELAQQHQQAINYWREVAREGEAERLTARQHIRHERAEEVDERQRGLTQ
jgi:hypothetical protein